MLSATRIERRRSLADQVYDVLCESIIAGELGPGDRLVFEQLAPRLGVSQTPIREAVVHLVQDGLAESGPDGKLQVVPLTTQYVQEIFLVRGALEGLATELATSQLSEGDLAELQSLLEQGSVSIDNGNVSGYGHAGAEFHRRVIDAAGNVTLARELRSIRTHYMRIRNFSQRQYGEHLVRAQEEHWTIFNALASRDANAARSGMEEHVRQSGVRIAHLIETESAANER